MQKQGFVKRKLLRPISMVLLACIMVYLFGTASQAANGQTGDMEYDVTPSKKEYTVEINSESAFIGSLREVDVTNGEAVYMTYTVKDVQEDTITQSGLIATKDNMAQFPYAEELGIMKYHHFKSLLLKNGYTYFIKFQVTEEYGYEVTVAYSNGSDEGYEMEFINVEGEVREGMKYCGIWLSAGSAKATLTHVRIYDKSGNDLGVVENGATVIDPTMEPMDGIEHSYAFSVEDQTCLAISNEKWTKSDVIYMEYTVKNLQKEDSTQTGVGMTNNPTAQFPHTGTSALLKYKWLAETEDSPLAKEGVTYLIRFKKTDSGFDATVEYTVDGKKVHTLFPNLYGTYNKQFGHAYLWLDGPVTADFVDIKCYDGEGKNLGIQVNDSEVEVIHYGGLEDYSVCESGYYCKEKEELIILKEDRSISISGTSGTDITGTYTVEDETHLLNMNADGKELSYEYYYINMVDKDGNKYVRLNRPTVTFVTGTENRQETASVENGYKIARPENPTLEGNEFKGWFLGDNTEYDFDKIVNTSVTVYAKWRDGDGNEYLATAADVKSEVKDSTKSLAIVVCVILVAATTAAGIWIIKRSKEHGV